MRAPERATPLPNRLVGDRDAALGEEVFDIPPAGLAGDRVSDNERTTLWLPPATKRQLNALSRYLGRPLWGIVAEALTAYKRTLSVADRKAMQQMTRR